MGEGNIRTGERQTEFPRFLFGTRPEPKDKGVRKIRSRPQDTTHRINITGAFVHLLNETNNAKQEGLGGNFHQFLALAEHSYGQRCVDLYQQLYEVARAQEKGSEKRQAKPELLKDLGLSLVRSGARTKGRELLTYYVDTYGSQQNLEEIGKLTESLIEDGEGEIAARMLDAIQEKVEKRKFSLPEYLKRHYEVWGTFTDQGKKQIDAFFKKRKDEVVTAPQFHDFVKNLNAAGEYRIKESSVEYAFRRPPKSYEEDYYESLIKLSNAARQFGKNANDLEDHNPVLAQSFRTLARDMYRHAIFGVRQRVRLRLEEWEDTYEGVHYDPQKGIAEFARQLEAHPKTNKNFGYEEESAREANTVLWAILGNKQLFPEGLDLLYSLDAGLQKTGLFKYAAEHLPEDLPSGEFEKFMQEWQRTVARTCEDLAENKFVEAEQRDRAWFLTKDTGIRPQSSKDIHLYNEQRVLMAETYLKRGGDAYHAEGIRMLQSLPESPSTFFNPHEYISHTNFIFTKPNGYSINRHFEFHQVPFKARALLKGAALSSEHSEALINQAYELAQRITIDPEVESFHQAEDKTYVLIELFESLAKSGDIERTSEVYKRVGHVLNKIEAVAQGELSDYEALSETEQNKQGFMSSYELEKQVELIKFWQQDYESRLKAQLAVCLENAGRHDEASHMTDELIDSFRREVSGRRERFDTRSMTAAAKHIADNEALAPQGEELFDVVIGKLGLVRNHEAVSFFSKSVRSSELSDEAKDKLLTQLVITLAPPKNKGEEEMYTGFAGFIKTVDEITSDHNYPKTESESLRVFADLVQEVHFDREEGYKSGVKLTAMKLLFENITKNNPEILYGSNFEVLLANSHDPNYLKHLASILPLEAERYYSGDIVKDGVFDLHKIRAGFYDRDTAYAHAKPELERILQSPAIAEERLEHMMQVYGELIRQELADFRNSKDKHTTITRDDLLQLQGIKDLYDLVAATLDDPHAQFSESEKKIVRTLLHAGSSEESNGKYALLKELLGNEQVPVMVQKIAFENLLPSGKISNYVEAHFENEVIGASDKEQKAFYEWIKEFLQMEDDKLPEDRVTSLLLENPESAKEFFIRYRTSKLYPTVNSDALDDMFRGSKEEFLAYQQKLAERDKCFVPDLGSEIDIVLAYEKRFHWFMGFDDYITGIKQIYIDQTFDIGGPYDYKYTYTPDQVEAEIRKYVPSFELNSEQKDKIRELYKEHKEAYKLRDKQDVLELPETRGVISYRRLIDEVTGDLSLTKEQRDRVITFLNGINDMEQAIVLKTFGRYEVGEDEKGAFDAFLDNVLLGYHKRQEKVSTAKIEIPTVFKNVPEIAQYMLTRYFVQLPYGERQAILSEFEGEQPLPPENAIKRFFEVTGMEKIGQFLSTRRDLLPEDYRLELEQFQENVEAGSFDEVRRTLERELGKPVEDIFSSIKLHKAGTIGEVYDADLIDGRRVAVKVITPSKRRTIQKTLERLEKVCRDLERNKDRFEGAFDPMGLYDEFRRSIGEELDFRKEYQNAEEMRPQLPGGTTIPEYVDELITESVLVQEYAKGVHIDEIKGPVLRKQIADDLKTLLYHQIIMGSLYHKDLHPGNVRVTHKGEGVNELLDLGRVGRITDEERVTHFPLMTAAQERSVDGIIDALVATSPEKHNFDRVGLEKSLKTLVADETLAPSTLMSSVVYEAGRSGLAISPIYLNILNAVMAMEGSVNQLEAGSRIDDSNS